MSVKNYIVLILIFTCFKISAQENDSCKFTYTSLEAAVKNPLCVKRLYLTNKGLNEIPHEINQFVNLEALNLSDNNIKEIDSTIISLNKLKALFFENNEIEEIPDFIFNFKYLELINLNHNKIKYISNKISNLKKLNTLFLLDNNLYKIPSSLFSLQNLKFVILSRNHIEKITVIQNSNVEKLNLGINHLKTIDVSYFKKLQELNLYDNDIEEIKGLDQIELLELQAQKNNITKLESIGSSKTLMKLNLFSNYISDINNISSLFPNIVKLNLSFNDITAIPKDVFLLSYLKEFDLRNNKIRAWPDLTNSEKVNYKLKYLYLGSNKISTISKSFIFCNFNTTYIDLSNNKLTSLELKDPVFILWNLEEINLSNNDLNYIDAGLFPGLNKLYISNNDITVLPKLPRLIQHIDASNNKITNLDNLIIGENEYLSFLNVNNNLITEIPPSITKLKSLELLDISNNRLSTLPLNLGELKFLDFLWSFNNPIEYLPDTSNKDLRPVYIREYNYNSAILKAKKSLLNMIQKTDSLKSELSNTDAALKAQKSNFNLLNYEKDILNGEIIKLGREKNNYIVEKNSLSQTINLQQLELNTKEKQKSELEGQVRYYVLLKNKQKLVILIIASVAIIFLFLVFMVARQKKKLHASYTELDQAHNELKETQTELMETSKNKAVSSIIQSYAHIINNSNNVIKGATEYMLKSIEHVIQNKKTIDLEKIQENSKLTIEASQRIYTLVDLFKNRSQEQFVDKYSLKEFLSVIYDLNKSTFSSMKINWKPDIPEDVTIRFDKSELVEVFQNLIQNTIEHAFTNYEKEEKEIAVTAFYSDQKLTIEYSDNGRGIKAENLNSIFDPFFSTVRLGRGTGLSRVKDIINSYQGQIICKSEETVGTKFLIYL